MATTANKRPTDWLSKAIEVMASGKRTTATHRALMWIGMAYLAFGQFDIKGAMENLNRLPLLFKTLEEHTRELNDMHEMLRRDHEEIRDIREILRRHNLASNQTNFTTTALNSIPSETP